MTDDLQASRAEFWTRRLLRDGFCIIRDAVSPALADAVDRDLDTGFAQAPFCKGDFYGHRTKRFGALLKRSPNIAAFIRHPLILAVAGNVLGPYCDRFNLNLTQAIEIHPGAPAQFPHRDQDMWPGPKGQIHYLLNVIWPLSEFTAANGGTRLWSRSHYPDAPDQEASGEPVVAWMTPGAALLFLGSTLHGAGANKATSNRRGVIISFCLGWLKPFENQWLCYPPAIARRFDPDLAGLVGYSLHRPNLGNYEGQSPSVLLGRGLPEYLAATDALRPEQEQALRDFVAVRGASEAPPADDSTEPRA